MFDVIIGKLQNPLKIIRYRTYIKLRKERYSKYIKRSIN